MNDELLKTGGALSRNVQTLKRSLEACKMAHNDTTDPLNMNELPFERLNQSNFEKCRALLTAQLEAELSEAERKFAAL